MVARRNQWKEDERDFAKWAAGADSMEAAEAEGVQRHASSGKSAQDLSGPWWTAEHKSTAGWPDYIRKAVDQANANRLRSPNKVPFIFLTIHDGRGRPVRRLICREVDISINNIEEISDEMDAAEDWLSQGEQAA